jgi:hypothetical protein
LAEYAQNCVVHLVRFANGVAPLRRFLDSYGRHPAGVSHDLLLLFKGFEPSLPDEYEELLKGIPHQRRFISDRGFDVDAYFGLARTHEAAAFCFLNSFSVILADGWLAHLHRALVEHDAGMVGATGSWQSLATADADMRMAAFSKQAGYPAWKRRLLEWLPFLRRLVPAVRRQLLQGMFGPFPNHHLRTNAFMIQRATVLDVRLAPLRLKFDAYRFESGKHGLTAQVLGMGKAVLVVGRDGAAYDRDNWHLSNTFWRRNQENLLVADNQTRSYENSDPDLRAVYSALAWGAWADAGPDRKGISVG